MIILAFTIIIIVIGTLLFLRTERFGKAPSGKRLGKLEQSPNYKNGSFQNLNSTPMLTEGAGYFKVLYKFIFSSKPKKPSTVLPSIKTDLKAINPNENVLIWMGHSSYYMQIEGKKMLVDPVLSGKASPLSFTTKAYPGSDIYTTDEIPEIDYLFLTHDHWDHMDYRTLIKLNPKIKKVVTGLGNGAHLEHWGFSADKIIEGDWYSSFKFSDDIKVHLTPARHFSGRGFNRNKTLWTSFALITPNFKLFLGGDSGYDTHFKEIGEKYGPFDMAVLENGQYDINWKYIHMLPGEQIKAANDLNAKRVFPVHCGKFTLANHDWNEPLKKITEMSSKTGIKVMTPMIGEKLYFDHSLQQFGNWWDFEK